MTQARYHDSHAPRSPGPGPSATVILRPTGALDIAVRTARPARTDEPGV